jgi:microsomal dipeptidase-like Zn-dependent dipeptidase
MGALSAIVDRAVNRTALPGRLPVSPTAQDLLQHAPTVDLLVGSALFRDSFLPGGRGHVDLPRLRATGVNVVGLTVATRWPNLRGSLSGWHFRSLGIPAQSTRSDMAMAEWLIGRIHGWCDESDGQLVVIRTRADLERCLAPGGPVGVVIGIQGGQVLESDLANVARLRAAGVRMFAPAHVMDNALVGSGTGRRARGVSDLGRDALRELEAQSIVVDLAHMSRAGIATAVPLLTRPFTLSHAGLTDIVGGRSRWRRFSPANRNVPASLVADIGAAGGLVGIALSTQLLGGSTLAAAVRTFRAAIDAAGTAHVGIGSDMDGALRMLIDVEGLPALADALLGSGLDTRVVRGVMGGNAAELLRATLPE